MTERLSLREKLKAKRVAEEQGKTSLPPVISDEKNISSLSKNRNGRSGIFGELYHLQSQKLTMG